MVSYSSTSAATIWYSWVEGTASTTSATTTTNATVWNGWVAAVDFGTANSTSATVWYKWNDNGNRQVYQYQPPPETEEQKQVRLQLEERRRVEADALKKERETANARANELLEEHLTDEQRRQLREIDAIIINLVSKQYRIKRDGAVHELNKDGKPIASYCIHPSGYFPPADVMLTKKLMLETDEGAFLRIANRTPIPVSN